ncbi:MAG: PD-(D/E)XK nuclease-like domain-containing protein [Christensenellales bacterium]
MLTEPTLTEGTYFSPAASTQYMSASQLKSFLTCEAQALAELSGEYRREETTALLVGSYVDAYFSDTLPQFTARHQEVFTKSGELKADFRQAADICLGLHDDELLRLMLAGESQRIVTGEIAGVPFKGKLDSLLCAEQCGAIVDQYPQMADQLLMADGAIVDLKVMRSAEAVWVNGRGKLSFVEAFYYDLQLGCYQRLIGGKLPCFLVVATKEKTPDKLLIRIPQYMMDGALAAVEPLIPRFQALKQGLCEAKRCERCDYCRQTKKITEAIDADDLEGSGV